MQKFNYDAVVEATSEKEADSKMRSAMVLLAKLSEKELTKLAHILLYDPLKLALAKKALRVE